MDLEHYGTMPDFPLRHAAPAQTMSERPLPVPDDEQFIMDPDAESWNQCPICLLPMGEVDGQPVVGGRMTLLVCGHLMCANCFQLSSSRGEVCPICRHANQVVRKVEDGLLCQLQNAPIDALRFFCKQCKVGGLTLEQRNTHNCRPPLPR